MQVGKLLITTVLYHGKGKATICEGQIEESPVFQRYSLRTAQLVKDILLNISTDLSEHLRFMNDHK